MSCVWLYSDTHFGHRSICKYRTHFSTPECHDEFVFNSITEVVRKRDTLWLLGDCFFTWESVKYLKQIPCQVNWVMGNHDTDNRERLDIAKYIISSGLVNKFGSMFKIKNFWLTHHPLHPEELRGRRNIHGHVHNATIQDSRYINVCVENVGYTPVKLQNLHEFDGILDLSVD